MYRIICLLLIAGFCWQCQSDNSVREEARAAATAMAQQTNQPAPAAQAEPNNAPAPVKDPNTGGTAPTVNAELVLSMGEAHVGSGENACLTVKAAGFTDLIGMQFTIRWDAAELQFDKVGNFSMPHLAATNFGLTRSAQGVAAFSWINPSLQATSLAHQAPLFDICFQAKAAAGTDAKVVFAPKPTSFEVINVDEEILKFKGLEGTIYIE